MRIGRWSPAAIGLLLLAVACRAPAPPPTATPAPASVVAPAPVDAVGAASPQPADDAAATEDAFLSNVDDLDAEAADLTVTPCEDLTAVLTNNPNLVPSMHGFADALKRVAASQPALDTDTVHAALADLDHTLGQLDGALGQCGIKQP